MSLYSYVEQVPLDSELFLWNISQVRGLSYRLTRQTGQVMSFKCWQVTEGPFCGMQRALGFAGGHGQSKGEAHWREMVREKRIYWGSERKGS